MDLRHEEGLRREEVVGLRGEFSGHYLGRSFWLEQGSRKKIDRLIDKSEDLYSDFVADIVDRGYARTREAMASRVSRELGPLKKEAEASLEAGLGRGRPIPVAQTFAMSQGSGDVWPCRSPSAC